MPVRTKGPPPFRYRRTKRPDKGAPVAVAAPPKVKLARPAFACIRKDGTTKPGYDTWNEADAEAIRRGHPHLSVYLCSQDLHGWHIGKAT